MDFRHNIPVTIRFGDLDSLGHVNNAVYLTYLEQARIDYVRTLRLWNGGMSDNPGLIMARAVIDYKLPMTLDDSPATVWTRCSRLGNRSFEMAHRITFQRDGTEQLAATGEITVVVFDYTLNQTVPIPAQWRADLTSYEPGLSDG